MKKFLKSLRGVKIVFRRSRPLTKIVALCAVVLCTLALLCVQGAVVESRERTADLQEQAQLLEQANQDLQQRIQELGTVQSTRQIAREELGLVDPDTVIIEPQQ